MTLSYVKILEITKLLLGSQKWVEALMETSYVSWKISKTMPEGRTNVFKQYLSCQHATDKRVTGKRSSKKINCPATLTITVQRSVAEQELYLMKVPSFF